MTKEFIDILIIGAGPSGMVSAGYLQQHGVNIKVVEKQLFPRFSIGESLIPRCMDNFEEAGLLEVLKNAGFQKKFGARFIKDEKIGEFDFSQKFGKGWDWTWQVPRADFDNILATEVQSRGVDIAFETEVIAADLSSENPIITIQDKNGNKTQIEAKFVIDSSGYGRVLAGLLDLEKPSKIESHSSMFTHIEETNRPKGKEGELITFEILETEVWFWYIPFSNGNTSLGFVAPTNWFKQFNDDPEIAFSEMLSKLNYYKTRFDDYSLDFTPKKINHIAKSVIRLYGNKFALTGNSAEFLDPVFSSGVSFATESGLKAAKLALKELKGEEIDWQLNYENYMNQGIDVFSSYVKAWYNGDLQDIIFHHAPNPDFKEKICAVLAGYVWNQENPFVKKHQRILSTVSNYLKLENI
ncbi:NAD(P)/FAD-dependent oxidoreductase [Zunongwangia endophytica]|uniref:NAD(P)/FAD-dependent oxidoreductase n=1 Tax=Zunongwangia endophytica TaxID=1808945 RepID=A0ABV8HHQ6_9FLAO|nr:NAD(P)/FAD-dependent oxidoreductase [Zunongwangia endophytica]MDN3593966.1 NAD(P)/FAD-dependent oxidoreductase [Zunongwangia endophytica]